ncbi:DUF748 domain-containing protein [Zunongwangia sp. H14]|uniref:DUF748 domain-containing protein n=1 Tax=Zunongwangia sp. H14 TaxID=3240792 RepID=UPI003562B2A3
MSKSGKQSKFRRKRYIIPAVIVILLIVARIMLPYILKRSVNRTLNNIPGYEGHVEDIDVALWRGAYVIEGLLLQKKAAKNQQPLLNFPESDISIEWKSLLNGKIVSEIEMHNPEFNYIFEVQQKENTEGEADAKAWTDALKELVPISINHLSINNGKANFVQLSADPEINMFLKQINLQATNLSNVVNKEETLPSNLRATAVSFGNGDVLLEGNLNLLKKIPDMDMEFSLKDADVRALNNLTNQYAGVDFEAGTFELYSEVAIADAYLKGYIKPILLTPNYLERKMTEAFSKNYGKDL